MENKKYYTIPYVSNSTLTWFKVSPKYCWKRMNLEITEEEKSYTYLGKQLHLSLLEPEEFTKCYTYLDFRTPTSKQQLGFCESFVLAQMNFCSKEDALMEAYTNNYLAEKLTPKAVLQSAEKLYESNVDYIKYLELKGDFREILSKSKQELITTITQAIKDHKKANALMFTDNNNVTENPVMGKIKNFNEFAVYWDYPIYWEGEAVKCKSLIDRLVVDHINKKVTIVDLKTTSVLGDFSANIIEREYYRQLSFYKLAVQYSKQFPKDYEIEAYIVAVNTQDPYECRVYKLSDSEYQKQLLVINSLMEQISWHWFTRKWNYSRTYYEGDGTENLIDEYSNQSIEGNRLNDVSEISFADVVFQR
jgi:hypothetical protein